MLLEHGLDLLRVHLLAAGVDAERAPAEQMDGAVGVDRRHVTGQRPALAVDLDERARAAIGILVVAERYAAAGGEPPDAAAPRRDRAQRGLVDDHRVGLGREGER